MIQKKLAFPDKIFIWNALLFLSKYLSWEKKVQFADEW